MLNGYDTFRSDVASTAGSSNEEDATTVDRRNDSSNGGRRRQGIFWMLTIPHHSFTPYLPPCCRWIKGQLERGEQGEEGYLHWQIICAFVSKKSTREVREIFGPFHAELSRSSRATEYVWKEATCVDASTRFELGVKPFQRNSARDWEAIWVSARAGEFETIPADVRVVSYRTLRAISADYDRPVAMVRTCKVFWGTTGTGKSHRAWIEAGVDAYPKDPRSKYWCGYQGEPHVIIDEFRGEF